MIGGRAGFRPIMGLILSLSLGVLLGAVPLLTQAQSSDSDADAVWLLIDSDKHMLTVMRGKEALDRFDRIAIGRGGTSQLRQRGDGSTPLGTYRIAWINRDSPFQLFFGFDFPSLEDGRRALEAGRISQRDFDRIEQAVRIGEIPPQDTPLGGRLGIHGLGGGSLEVHRDFNWTQGCIALTNDQIDRLGNWIALGTRVVVR